MLQADRNVSSFLINSFYILFFEETEIRPEDVFTRYLQDDIISV